MEKKAAKSSKRCLCILLIWCILLIRAPALLPCLCFQLWMSRGGREMNGEWWVQTIIVCSSWEMVRGCHSLRSPTGTGENTFFAELLCPPLRLEGGLFLWWYREGRALGVPILRFLVLALPPTCCETVAMWLSFLGFGFLLCRVNICYDILPWIKK